MRLTVLTVPLLAATAITVPVTVAGAAGPDVTGLDPLGSVPGLAVPAAAPGAAPVPGQEAASDQAAVDVRDNSFSPSRIEIEVGDTVVWTQTGTNPHTVTAEGGSFDSHPNCTDVGTGDCMQQGDTFSHTFRSPGEVRYVCRVHDQIGMTGVVVVKAKSTPAPQDSDDPPADTGSGNEETTAPTLPDTGANAATGIATGMALLLLGAVAVARRRAG